MKNDVSALVPKLIEALRHELQEYGEMLALLDQQQDSVTARAAEEVLRSVTAITEQSQKIQTARQQRESRQIEVALVLGKADGSSFVALIPSLPQQYRVAIEALVRENNALLIRVQQRARQNHLLLSRSLQLMQQFIELIVPATGPATYNGEGTLKAPDRPAKALYEAVG